MTTSNNFGAFTTRIIGNHQTNDGSINSMPASITSAGSTGSSLPSARSITPRHAVFTNLDEAHKAITARAAKQAAHTTDNGADAALIPTESSAGSSVNAVYSKSTTDTDEHPATESHPCPTHDGFSRGRRISPTHLRRRSSSVPDLRTRALPYPDWDEMTPAARACCHAAQDPVDNHTPDNNSTNTPRETGSTVENIVDQYLPSTTTNSSTSSDGSHNHYNHSTTVHHTLGNGQTINPPQTRQNITSVPFGRTSKLFRSHGPPPQIPQPPIPVPAVHSSTLPAPAVVQTNLPENHLSVPEQHLNITRENSWATMSSADSDTEELAISPYEHYVGASAGFTDSNQHLEANRYESFDTRAARSSPTKSGGLSREAFSTGGLTTDSDEDPFKYDRGSYTVFLQPSREREVSEALHRVSGVSTTYTNETHRNGQASSSRGPVGAAAPTRPVNGLTYCNTSSQSNNNDSNRPVMKKLRLRSYNPDHLKWDEDFEEDFEDEFDQDLDENFDAAKTDRSDWETVGSNLDAIKSDRGEWETVGSSVGQFNSHRAYASGTGFGTRFGLRTTGSSIADDSDLSGRVDESFGAYGSTERIMQHPMKGTKNRYVLRTLKGDNRPVFLPQPRIHRVNGYPQDSCRLFDQATTSSSQGSSTRAYLAEKLSAPFRSFSSRNNDRRHPYGNSQSGPDSGNQHRGRSLRVSGLPPQTPQAHDSFHADRSIGPESPPCILPFVEGHQQVDQENGALHSAYSAEKATTSSLSKPSYPQRTGRNYFVAPEQRKPTSSW
ncbi:hypothetical protein B0T20DRAFT_464517 [Sordaria brevicollis]|uniref:Uncharacterized protein n=1 Tax=Sordaria brevicollis TaxID=83679 RepID=A0AAE0U2U3_SORBR|nr:hypothetical protein B0T20DRAFT_464517 [Sordaria brevicollis]